MTRQRRVALHLGADERVCLYCLGADGPFTQEEHVVQRAFGREADDYVLRPGAVCDPCNGFLGRQVDAPFTDRLDIKLMRGLEGLRARGGRVHEIQCVNPVARLDCEVKPGIGVAVFVSKFERLPNGGFRADVRPKHRDPVDIVARTIRALWKIGLGVMRGAQGRAFALDPRWDPLREAILGGAFDGYLVQAPFRVIATGEIHVDIDPSASPPSVMFRVGGVLLSAPLSPASDVPSDIQKLRADGWSVLRVGDQPPPGLVFELEPGARQGASPAGR